MCNSSVPKFIDEFDKKHNHYIGEFLKMQGQTEVEMAQSGVENSC